jgi:hypothetical protein
MADDCCSCQVEYSDIGRLYERGSTALSLPSRILPHPPKQVQSDTPTLNPRLQHTSHEPLDHTRCGDE